MCGIDQAEDKHDLQSIWHSSVGYYYQLYGSTRGPRQVVKSQLFNFSNQPTNPTILHPFYSNSMPRAAYTALLGCNTTKYRSPTWFLCTYRLHVSCFMVFSSLIYVWQVSNDRRRPPISSQTLNSKVVWAVNAFWIVLGVNLVVDVTKYESVCRIWHTAHYPWFCMVVFLHFPTNSSQSIHIFISL